MHLHVLNIIRKRAGCMLLGGGSMCEAGGCRLQGEEGDASGFLSPPTRTLLLCLHSLQRPTPKEWSRELGRPPSLPRTTWLAQDFPLPPEAWRNHKHPLRKGACIRMNPSRLSDHLQTIYQIDPLLGAGSNVAEAQGLRVGVLRYCQQNLHWPSRFYFDLFVCLETRSNSVTLTGLELTV